ncbi:MAG: GDP-mannose 4,6-dehydratase, partial [Methanothrix sp.]|nr:GDP-mannose 4,6-dehydratase [Methanothrix sp.]
MGCKNKNILITGINGFVGSLLARELIDRSANVYGLVRRRSDGQIPYNIQRQKIEKGINLIEGDLENISSLGNAITISSPDIIFHFGAQSFIPRSFSDPLETMNTNCCGTANLLEAIRLKDADPIVVFAGSSEEYGLVISSSQQYDKAKSRYGAVFPEPHRIPEIPISEENPLRPMSPYAVSKVYGDYLMRNYWHSYGIKAVVSRAFNHEGAGRGAMFVTSAITSQVMKLKFDEIDSLSIGNVNAFRDWSHVSDIIDGYIILAEKGEYGAVYNQGSERTNSVISFLLLSLEGAGYEINKIETFSGDKAVNEPLIMENSSIFGMNFKRTRLDEMMLREKLEFDLNDTGIIVHTHKGEIKVNFDPKRFRPAEVPILLSDARKIKGIGYSAKSDLKDVIS